MELDDRIAISTPEGVEIDLQLAGAGSRSIAGAIDLAIQSALLVLAAVLIGAVLGVSGGLGAAVYIVVLFLVYWGYDVLFEVLAAGRTPGKWLTHLRVVRASGAQIDLPASALRNVCRAVDGMPTAYLPTLLCILLTRRNQRPGDLAAGTLVIREAATPRRRRGRRTRGSEPPAAAGIAVDGVDASAVTGTELATVRRFLERREELDPAARRQLARRLEQGLRPRVSGVPEGRDPERFLEAVAVAKARGRGGGAHAGGPNVEGSTRKLG